MVLVAVGCGGGSDQKSVYPVTGKITMEGNPVVGATVTFSPTENQADAMVAMGKTDSEGVYNLTTYDADDGAGPGVYRVLVTKRTASKVAAGSEEATHSAMAAGTGGAPVHGGGKAANKEDGEGHLLNEKYSKNNTTTLEATVTEGGPNTFDFTLDP